MTCSDAHVQIITNLCYCMYTCFYLLSFCQVIRQSLNGSGNSSFLNYGSTNFTNLEWAFAVSIFSIGGMFGALPSGAMADCIGRKWSMLANNVIAVVGLALQSLAVNPYMLIAGRFVIGVNAGKHFLS